MVADPVKIHIKTTIKLSVTFFLKLLVCPTDIQRYVLKEEHPTTTTQWFPVYAFLAFVTISSSSCGGSSTNTSAGAVSSRNKVKQGSISISNNVQGRENRKEDKHKTVCGNKTQGLISTTPLKQSESQLQSQLQSTQQ